MLNDDARHTAQSSIFRMAHLVLLLTVISYLGACRSGFNVGVSNKGSGGSSPDGGGSDSGEDQDHQRSEEVSDAGDEQKTNDPGDENLDNQFIGGMLTSPRSYLQTRNVIVLFPGEDLIRSQSAFSLGYDSSEVPLLEDVWGGEVFESQDGWRFDGAQAQSLEIYPTNALIGDLLPYGEAVWRFSLLDVDNPAYSTTTLTLKDFDIFAGRFTTSRQGRQVLGGFQGWTGTRRGKAHAPDSSRMTTGFLNIVNR